MKCSTDDLGGLIPSRRRLPQPNSCSARPRRGPGKPFYDETGYSGNGTGRNNPDAQDETDTGPIPQGGWNMDGNWYNKKPGPGLNIMNLNPLPGNECFDTERNCKTFRMHGDNATHTASEGWVAMSGAYGGFREGRLRWVVLYAGLSD